MKSNQWLTLGSHLILKKWCDASDRNFQKQFNALETTQRQILHSILQTSTLAKDKQVQNYEQFVKLFLQVAIALGEKTFSVTVNKSFHSLAVSWFVSSRPVVQVNKSNLFHIPSCF